MKSYRQDWQNGRVPTLGVPQAGQKDALKPPPLAAPGMPKSTNRRSSVVTTSRSSRFLFVAELPLDVLGHLHRGDLLLLGRHRLPVRRAENEDSLNRIATVM